MEQVQAHWVTLIDHFRLPAHTADAFQNYNQMKACREVFRQWLDGGDELLSPKTWETLTKVIRHIGKSAIADEICAILEEQRYCDHGVS